jgi:hypothetical protein
MLRHLLSMHRQLSLAEIQQRLDFREGIESHEVLSALQGAQTSRRQAAHALFLSRLRESLTALAIVAEAEGYTNQVTVSLMQQLADIADDPRPSLEMLKAMGIHAVEMGATADGLRILQSVTDASWAHAQRSGPYFQRLMSYMHDSKIDNALTCIAQQYSTPQFIHKRTAIPTIILLTSCVVDENSPSMVTVAIAEGLRKLKNRVVVVSSEFSDSRTSKPYHRLRELGFQVELTSMTTPINRVATIIKTCEQLQADAALYLITPMDFVAKIVSAVGVAPTQCMFNMAYEPYCGNFDLILQTTSPDQETITAWPGKSKFVGSFAALESSITHAASLDRTILKRNKDDVLLITHGRVAKCSTEYLTAARYILEANSTAYLILAGPTSTDDLTRIEETFCQSPAVKRVLLLGSILDTIPELLKTCDIYLDPFPWPGGQSTLEAMWASLPIVSMQAKGDLLHDIATRGPIGSATDAFLPPSYERALAGDLDGYTQLASRYIQDRERRKEAGIELHSHVQRMFSHDEFMQRLHETLQETITMRSASLSFR